jgi:hypothetical protein
MRFLLRHLRNHSAPCSSASRHSVSDAISMSLDHWMHQPPFADFRSAKKRIVSADRREDGVFGKMGRNVDNAFGAAPPQDNQRTALIGANRFDIRGVSHIQSFD